MQNLNIEEFSTFISNLTYTPAVMSLYIFIIKIPIYDTLTFHTSY